MVGYIDVGIHYMGYDDMWEMHVFGDGIDGGYGGHGIRCICGYGYVAMWRLYGRCESVLYVGDCGWGDADMGRWEMLTLWVWGYVYIANAGKCGNWDIEIW